MELVQQLIREQMKAKDLPQETSTFHSESLQNFLEKVKLEKTNAIDTERFKLPEPSTAATQEWTKSLNNAKSQYMHQMTRIENLELFSEYGSNNWQLYLHQLQALLDSITIQVTQKQQNVLTLKSTVAEKQAAFESQLQYLQEKRADLTLKLAHLERALANKV